MLIVNAKSSDHASVLLAEGTINGTHQLQSVALMAAGDVQVST